MHRGDHIKIGRGFYSHHGIFIDRDQVVHFSGEPKQKNQSQIEMTTLEQFINGAKETKVKIVAYEADVVFDTETTIRLALESIGDSDYHIVFRNCEHFATYCKTGKHESKQVKRAFISLPSTGVIAASLAAGLYYLNKNLPKKSRKS